MERLRSATHLKEKTYTHIISILKEVVCFFTWIDCIKITIGVERGHSCKTDYQISITNIISTCMKVDRGIVVIANYTLVRSNNKTAAASRHVVRTLLPVS